MITYGLDEVNKTYQDCYSLAKTPGEAREIAYRSYLRNIKEYVYEQDDAYWTYEENIDYIDPLSAFHKDNIGQSTLIMLTRIYDVQMTALALMDVNAAERLEEMHEGGNFLASPPSFSE